MSAPKEILALVARFEQQLAAYKSGQYNETQLRREFLDPFWKALGWDVDNTAGYAEAYKDVIHEDAIRIGGVLKAPDYSFRIGGARKFFLEAKKPSVFIKEEIPPAFQLRCYGWNAKLPLSVLSDFEEFAIYDCRFKPHKDDPAATARIFYCTFRDYVERWDWIAERFSREAVLKGGYDRFAESTKAKRGTIEVDAAFLATIEGWRLELARNLALRNPKLTQRELNFAVQRIIDRIIFLRICEDRGIEDFGRLQALTNDDRIYPRLCQLFEAADARYNSGLFHFRPEPDRQEPPDELTLGLQVDDKLLRDIFKALYYPDSSYAFSLIPADILGQVYEQFLGKVIRLTPGHRAVVEEKPEVKKAGGVYYTPTYIVDYIVRQTVGTLLDRIVEATGKPRSPGASGAESGRVGECVSGTTASADPLPLSHFPTLSPAATPRTASRILDRVSQLRILDPACGSGSFLIGAYQYLLDWHLQFYLANDHARWAKGGQPALIQTTKGWRLTIAERKRILLNNLFGVDIDSQAVEVTKLSLLLKVLEGETQQTIEPLFRLFHERALPDLGGNIKCGNSLIGPDFYEQADLPLLSDEERYRINVFDWQAEFPQILRRGTSGSELRDAPPAMPLDYTWPAVPLHGSYAYKKKKVKEPAPSPAPLEFAWEAGFDAVIGNPPYVRIQGFPPMQIAYFSRRYPSATGNFDLYIPFVERGLELLRDGGRLAMITPNKFFRTDYGEGLRRTLSANQAVCRIVDFGANQVFRATPTLACSFCDEAAPPLSTLRR
ncbi:MAG: Eco57I restriction-modification methylase domain-containing protein [Verrucomicrobia bacterium]|nr:Eco57I restriction-modification methylase domain-containing protein [Verrucomicrobiota bacterium]